MLPTTNKQIGLHIVPKRVATLFLTALALLYTLPIAAQEYRLLIPSISLIKNQEYIEAIDVKTTCGHINGITYIPYDWGITIANLSSGVEELHAVAGHGAARLSALGSIGQAIKISEYEKNCTDLSVTIVISGKHERSISLPLTKLKLEPEK
ncbi:MAG: hypothetical protein KAY06_01815 [Aeromonadaceae bacterium]|nr:hypothetical protein [Aeromonadaceae bacterium]